MSGRAKKWEQKTDAFVVPALRAGARNQAFENVRKQLSIVTDVTEPAMLLAADDINGQSISGHSFWRQSGAVRAWFRAFWLDASEGDGPTSFNPSDP